MMKFSSLKAVIANSNTIRLGIAIKKVLQLRNTPSNVSSFTGYFSYLSFIE